MSNEASIREAVTFACWPPGPDERDARIAISVIGMAIPSRMRRESDIRGRRFPPLVRNFPECLQLQSPGRQRQEPQSMEASAIHAPAAVGRVPLAAPLLRLRSDEQLLAYFRRG